MADEARGLDYAFQLHAGVVRRRRSLAVAQISEDQAQVLDDRIALDLDLWRERRIFQRRLDTLARSVVLPAVVAAADLIAFDPADRKLCAAVSAALLYQVRRTSLFAPVKREVLAH